MGCCGQGRKDLANHRQPTQPTISDMNGAWASAPSGEVALRYLKAAPILVRGPITGRHYQFSGEQPVTSVDLRDAGTLIRTSLFSRQL